jgi:CheY-like chemotaxis protein
MSESARRILIVDDNYGVTQLLSRMLTAEQAHEISVCHRGGDVFAHMEESRPEIVFLDIGLPDVSGYDVARAIRREQRFDDVLLIAVTGHGEPEDRAKALEAGFDEHLAKPPAKGALQTLLRHPKLGASEDRSASPDAGQVAPPERSGVIDAQPGSRLSGDDPSTRLRSIIHELGNAGCVVSLAGTLLAQSQDAAQVQGVGRMLEQLRPSLEGLVAALREVQRELERGRGEPEASASG